MRSLSQHRSGTAALRISSRCTCLASFASQCGGTVTSLSSGSSVLRVRCEEVARLAAMVVASRSLTLPNSVLGVTKSLTTTTRLAVIVNFHRVATMDVLSVPRWCENRVLLVASYSSSGGHSAGRTKGVSHSSLDVGLTVHWRGLDWGCFPRHPSPQAGDWPPGGGVCVGPGRHIGWSLRWWRPTGSTTGLHLALEGHRDH